MVPEALSPGEMGDREEKPAKETKKGPELLEREVEEVCEQEGWKGTLGKQGRGRALPHRDGTGELEDKRAGMGGLGTGHTKGIPFGKEARPSAEIVEGGGW